MDKEQLVSFKLAGLRAGELVSSAAHNSCLVRLAMRADVCRKKVKNQFKCWLKNLGFRLALPTDKLTICVRIRGGIGDVCMTRVWVHKLRQMLPQAYIAVSYDHPKVAEMVFSDGLIDQILPADVYLPKRFDVALSGCHFFMYDFIQWSRVEKLAPALMPILRQGLDVQSCFKPFADYSPNLDGQLAEISIAHGGSRITNLGWFTGLEVQQNDPAPIRLSSSDTKKVLDKLALNEKIYLTIHDGINNDTDASCGHPTRCWPKTFWKELVERLKLQFPSIQIVQLGGNQSQIFDFVDISLIGQTSVADLPHVLSKSLLHIDGESGMVHLANLTQTPCVVLFGPSKAAYLGYKRNTNLSAPGCGGCMNISRYWMTRCLLGFAPEKQCMAQLTVDQVFEAVRTRLSSILS